MLKKTYIDINNKKINLENLDIDELNKLNFQEETYFANKIKELPPFSKKRLEYSNQAYQKIFQIADWKKVKSKIESKKKGNGVTDATVQLLFKLIELYKKQESIFLYEAGVGAGYAIDKLKSVKNITIKGCDVFLSDNSRKISKENDNVEIKEQDLYHHLQNIEDNSIDIFYADNVIEHIVEDEYGKTFETIVSKVKVGGILFLVIPNASIGPSDVSKYFLNEGEKAQGFHFMEKTYTENMTTFRKYKVKSKYLAYRKNGEIKLVKSNKLLENLKMKMEKLLLKIKSKRARHKSFKLLGYDIYLLEKKSK